MLQTRERKHAMEVHGGVHPSLVLEKLGCPKQEDQMQAIEPDGSGRPGERGPAGNELYPNRGERTDYTLPGFQCGVPLHIE